MKKTFIFATLLIFAASTAAFAQDNTTINQNSRPAITSNRPDMPPPKGPDFKKRQAEFDQRLNLTDEQKTKAEQIRKQGFEQMKPIMEKMKEKQQAAQTLKGQDEKLEQLNKEIGALKKEAHELRMKNMKEFEGILTKDQQKELDKMKEEGRKKFDQEHKNRPPFGIPPQETK